MQPRLPVSDFCFRSFELRQPIFGPSLVGNELLDIAIELRLSSVDLAMARFDRGLARLQSVVAFVPGCPIIVECLQPGLQIGFAFFELRFAGLQASLALGERFLANLSELAGTNFGNRFPFQQFLLAQCNRLGSLFEFLLPLGQPLPRVLPLRLEVGFLRNQRALATIQLALF